MRAAVLAVMLAGFASAQNFDLGFFKTTIPMTTQPMRGGAVNQFHQLTVIASDVTSGSCSAGWSGVIYLEASQDGFIYTQLGPSITAVANNALQYVSASGSFQYIRINYLAGVSTCLLTAWYSGTTTGYPSFNTGPAAPVQIAGNGALLAGQQAVTGTATALAAHPVKQACLKALAANTINVYFGPSGVTTSTGMELAPDEAICLPVNNTNLFYVIASTTGASVSWSATN